MLHRVLHVMTMVNFKHGHTSRSFPGSCSPTFKSWAALVQRCTNPRHIAYERYHARWYEPWRDFATFLADMGERPDGTTIDRIDDSLGYGPHNCRWATRPTQTRNSRASKLTAEQVAEIRRIGRSVQGDILARRYGVTPTSISNILNNRTWRPK